MKKIFAAIVFSLFYVGISSAVTHTVLVGQGNTLTFSPNTLSVVVGDVVHFEWVSGSHTTTSVTVPSGASTWTNSITSTSTSFDYTVAVAGTYDYKCNPHGGSGMTGSFTATTTGVTTKYSDIRSSSVLTPNPVVDQTVLKFTSASSFKATVRIYDITGVFISEEKIKIEQGDNAHSLNVANLTTGMYYVNVLDKDDAFLVLRLIKQ
ncbi:MAG: T9SS type A sorting domain-containing protein [Cytophagaceae bacterium]